MGVCDGDDLVSVIIPTKDRHLLLRRAALSVAAQDHRPIELIVIDDGSTPAVTTEDLPPESSDLSVLLIRNETGGGVANARNTGISLAKGRWIAFLDDDDQYLPKRLSTQLAEIAKARAAGKSKVLGASCQITLVDSEGARIGNLRREADRESVLSNLLLSDENLTPSTLLFDRAVFDRIGVFRTDMVPVEDREFILRYAMEMEFVIPDVPLILFTEHSGPRLTRNSKAMLHGERGYLRYVAEHVDCLGGPKRRILAYRRAKVGHEAMTAGQWGEGITMFAKGITTWPFDKRVAGGTLLSLLGPSLYRRIMAFRMERLRS